MQNCIESIECNNIYLVKKTVPNSSHLSILVYNSNSKSQAVRPLRHVRPRHVARPPLGVRRRGGQHPGGAGAAVGGVRRGGRVPGRGRVPAAGEGALRRQAGSRQGDRGARWGRGKTYFVVYKCWCSYPTRIDHTFCFFKTIICLTTCSRWKKMCPMSVAEPLCSRETMTRAYFLVMCSQCRCRTPSCYTFFSIMLTINEYLGQHNMMYSIENGHVIFCLNCAHRCCSSI